MRHYPVFFDLRSKTCLVFGGGKVAARKIATLLDCEARIVIIAPEATSGLQEMAREGRIDWRRRGGRVEDLDDDPKPFLVFLCSDDEDFQTRISSACRARGIPVNAADSPAHCSFILPSVIRRGSLQMAISTGGECPALARALRERWEGDLGSEYEIFTRLAGEIRRADIAAGIDADERRRRLDVLLDGGALEAIREGGEEAGKRKMEELL